MNWVKKVETALIKVETAILVFLLSLMVVMSFTQVILRQFFSIGILWGDTFLRHIVLWVGFLGAALATADNKHFAWDTIVDLLEKKTRSKVMLLAHAAAAAITTALIHASWMFFLDEKSSGSILFSIGERAVPSWIFFAIVPIGFALVLIHTLLKAALELSPETK